MLHKTKQKISKAITFLLNIGKWTDSKLTPLLKWVGEHYYNTSAEYVLWASLFTRTEKI